MTSILMYRFALSKILLKILRIVSITCIDSTGILLNDF